MMAEELIVQICNDTKTIALMDEFERRDEDWNKIYTALVLSDVFLIQYRRKFYFVSLVLKRMPQNATCLSSGLTFTAFKTMFCDKVFSLSDRGSNILSKSCVEGVQKTFHPDVQEMRYEFPTPIRFNAQNSGNRSGYGSRYRWGEPVYEGTLYGETTDYMFTEARFRRCR
jgi:hypothetical protein